MPHCSFSRILEEFDLGQSATGIIPFMLWNWVGKDKELSQHQSQAVAMVLSDPRWNSKCLPILKISPSNHGTRMLKTIFKHIQRQAAQHASKPLSSPTQRTRTSLRRWNQLEFTKGQASPSTRIEAHTAPPFAENHWPESLRPGSTSTHGMAMHPSVLAAHCFQECSSMDLVFVSKLKHCVNISLWARKPPFRASWVSSITQLRLQKFNSAWNLSWDPHTNSDRDWLRYHWSETQKVSHVLLNKRPLIAGSASSAKWKVAKGLMSNSSESSGERTWRPCAAPTSKSRFQRYPRLQSSNMPVAKLQQAKHLEWTESPRSFYAIAQDLWPERFTLWLLKVYLQGQEPLAHKGGYLVPIWKGKLSKDVCGAFRSILHLIPWWERRFTRPCAQSNQICITATFMPNNLEDAKVWSVSLGGTPHQSFFAHLQGSQSADGSPVHRFARSIL